MSNTVTIDDIRSRHEDLYIKALQLGTGQEKETIIPVINDLIKDIEQCSETVNSLEDYRSLNDMAMKWQSIFSTVFNSPRNILLTSPKNVWKPPIKSVYTENEIENWLRQVAEFVYLGRRIGTDFNENDQKTNWHLAEVFFASEVIDGRINFASRISSGSYWRLENIWLKEVKLMMAYYRWAKHKDDKDHNKDLDYFYSCDHIRNLFVDKKTIYYELTSLAFQRLQGEGISESVSESIKPLENIRKDKDAFIESLVETLGEKDVELNKELILKYAKVESGIKALLTEFDPIKYYIKEHYLDAEGKLIYPLKASRKLYELIKRKAERIYKATGSVDHVKNWEQAELYVKMFYESIIPAVVDSSEENILKVLKTFQFSVTNRYLIIDCFEASLAIYFLNPDIISSLWEQSEINSTFSAFSNQVEVETWPQSFQVYDSEGFYGKFWFDNRFIGYDGVMTDHDKKILIDTLKSTEGVIDIGSNIEAIEDLYKRSRLINKLNSI